MALTFNPPDWLIQQSQNQPNQGLQAVDAFSKAAGAYVQQKALKQQQQQEALKQYIDAFGTGGPDLAGQVAQRNGLANPPALPGGPTPPVVNTSTQTPTAVAGTADQQGNPVISAPTISPIVQAHLAAGNPNHAGLNYQPPTPEQMAAFQNQGAYGQKKIAEANTAMQMTKADLETQKLQKELAAEKGPLQTVTKEQALKNGTFDPTKQLMVEPPAPRLDIGEKEMQFYQKEWDKIVHDTNPLTASGRTSLGMAAKADFQANRALSTLSKPIVTNQEAGNAMADIAAIYQNGSPTQYGMSHQGYSTLYGKIQGALQTVTGNPQDALPNPIKERLIGVLHDMKATNNSVLKQQLDFTEKSKAKIIKQFPDEWRDIRSTFESGMSPETAGLQPAGSQAPHGQTVTQNGHTYTWNGSTYE